MTALISHVERNILCPREQSIGFPSFLKVSYAICRLMLNQTVSNVQNVC